MFRSFQLGTAFGIRIFLHWTFLLLPAFVFLSNLADGSLPLAVHALIMIVAVFGCVLLHELGHALMARRFGIGTRDITLYPIGGVARLERMSEHPREELWIALAGPAVNVGIAAVLWILLALAGVGGDPEALLETALGGNLAAQLLVTNVGLALFNLLPAFPMDGGRVLRALLVRPFGRLRATEIAAGLGLVMAIGFFVLAWWETPMLMLVGVFVVFAGQQELAAVRYQEARRWNEPREVLPVDEDVVEGPAPWNQPHFTGFTWDRQAQAWIEWRNGRPVHVTWVD